MQQRPDAEDHGASRRSSRCCACSKTNACKAFRARHRDRATIIPVDETRREGRPRTEFLGVLVNVLPQLSAMIAARAEDCGVLRRGAQVRGGSVPRRPLLDGAVDELVELMKQKADQPKGDDPTTATNKTAIQIEQIKQQRAAEGRQARPRS